jgi:hypothetical protein
MIRREAVDHDTPRHRGTEILPHTIGLPGKNLCDSRTSAIGTARAGSVACHQKPLAFFRLGALYPELTD